MNHRQSSSKSTTGLAKEHSQSDNIEAQEGQNGFTAIQMFFLDAGQES